MIELYDMNSAMEELEPDAESRETKIGRLDEDHDRSSRESEKLGFNRLYLWIDYFFSCHLDCLVMVKSFFTVFFDIM